MHSIKKTKLTSNPYSYPVLLKLAKCDLLSAEDCKYCAMVRFCCVIITL